MKFAWLLWIPFFSKYINAYVLCNMAGDKEVKIFDGNFIFEKEKIPSIFENTIMLKNRMLSFWAYLVVDFLGGSIVKILIVGLNFIPGIGQVASLIVAVISAAPKVFILTLDYIYLRDIAHLFSLDKKNNNIIAIIVSVLDGFVTSGFARAIYFYTIMKKQPLDTVIEIEAKPIEE